jgi:hypothetical protein
MTTAHDNNRLDPLADAIRMAITLMDDTLDKYQPNDPSDFGFGSFDIDHDYHTAQGTQP